MTIETGNVMVNGVRIHFRSTGKGDPVLLLHGWPETSFMWRKIMDRIGDDYQVIAPDCRGFGDSTLATDGFDTETQAEDMSQLLDALDVGPVHVVGHDMGGVHGYALAAKYPEKVRTFTYLDEPLPSQSYEDFASFRALHENGGFWFAFFNMVPDLPEFLVQGREKQFLTHIYTNLAFHSDQIGPEAIAEYTRCFSKPGGFRASIGVYRAIADSSDQIAELSKTKLAMPVMAWGAQFGMGEQCIKDMRAVADNVTGGVIEDCGHYIAEEKPDELADYLRRFWAGEEVISAASSTSEPA